jgi:hypothetical protein
MDGPLLFKNVFMIIIYVYLRRIWDTLHWHKDFKSTFLQKNGKSNFISI